MNKNELVEAVAEQVGDRRLAAATVEAVLDTVTRAVTGGERVALSGFGVFEKAERSARTARNPATGGTVQVAATAVPRFRAGQAFKDTVSGKRALPERAAPPTVPSRRATRPPDAVAPSRRRGGGEDDAGTRPGEESRATRRAGGDGLRRTTGTAEAEAGRKAARGSKAQGGGKTKGDSKTKSNGKTKANGKAKGDSKAEGKSKAKGQSRGDAKVKDGGKSKTKGKGGR